MTGGIRPGALRAQSGLKYTEEAFATLLSGPLSPEDAGHSEETPAVLLMQLTAENPTGSERQAHLWLSLHPGEQLSIAENRVEAVGDVRGNYEKPRLRVVNSAVGHWLQERGEALHLSFPVPPGGTKNLVFKLPFVSDVEGQGAAELERLDYDSQRSRVISYWTAIVQASVRFTAPEAEFNDLLQSLIAHIHISTKR